MIVTVTLVGFGGGGERFDLRSKMLSVCFSSLTASVNEEQPAVPGLPSLLLFLSMATLLPLHQY